MAQSNCEADAMLDVYIHDYFVKNKLYESAKAIKREAMISEDTVVIDAPEGFLFELWSVFWEIFIASTNEKHSEAAASYLEVQRSKARELQQLKMQQLQFMHQAQLLRRNPNHPCHGNPLRLKRKVNIGGVQRSLTTGTSAIYVQGIIQSKPGSGNAGLNSGLGGLPRKEIDQLTSSMGTQVQRPLSQGANQFPLMSQQQQQHDQQLLAQKQAQKKIVSSPVDEDMNPRRLQGLSGGSMTVKDGQPTANDGLLGSPMQSTSQIKIQEMLPSCCEQDSLQQQQSQQSNRKRKCPSSSRAANCTVSGDAVGHLHFQPSTPSTHTSRDAEAPATNMQDDDSVLKSSITDCADRPGALSSSANQLEYIDHFGDIESYFSLDDEDGNDFFDALEGNTSGPDSETSKGFSFNELGSIRQSNGKVVCCHFSSDGTVLASAGHDKKVVFWDMETLQTKTTPEEHCHIITDVRFRPNSTQLATSSFDATIRLWDATEPSFCSETYRGHAAHVMSLDFHPKQSDLFCSCDCNNEIRLWSISQHSCTHVFGGGSSQVRFQPRTGQLLAAASDNIVSIFDIEADRPTQTFRGHSTEVRSVCWDAKGEYLASVSQESVRVWSLAAGQCIHQLSSSGNNFHSCVFHPCYSNVLVIGGYQSLELWNMPENKCMTVAAHDCIIAALAQSPVTGMIASASNDKSVKIWK